MGRSDILSLGSSCRSGLLSKNPFQRLILPPRSTFVEPGTDISYCKEHHKKSPPGLTYLLTTQFWVFDFTGPCLVKETSFVSILRVEQESVLPVLRRKYEVSSLIVYKDRHLKNCHFIYPTTFLPGVNENEVGL